MAKKRQVAQSQAMKKKAPFSEASKAVKKDLTLLWGVLGSEFSTEATLGKPNASPKRHLKRAA